MNRVCKQCGADARPVGPRAFITYQCGSHQFTPPSPTHGEWQFSAHCTALTTLGVDPKEIYKKSFNLMEENEIVELKQLAAAMSDCIGDLISIIKRSEEHLICPYLLSVQEGLRIVSDWKARS